MKKYTVRILKIVIFTWMALFFISSQALAAFSLSVAPYQGGYDLRFDKVTPATGRVNREVTVNITTDIAKQYRLMHTLLEPLSTLEGNRIPQNSFVVYGIRGTNRYGTLSVEQEVPVMLSRQVLYTSNQAGDADSFTLVYGLLPAPEIVSGSYRGRIAFILEPIDSTQERVTAIMNISAEFTAQASVEIRTETGVKYILLKAGSQESSSAAVLVEIKGGFGTPFKILQLVTEQPVSSQGSLLDWQAVNFLSRQAQRGVARNESTPLSPQSQEIYTSSSRGEADSFLVEYRLGDLSNQKAGRYRAMIKYVLQGLGYGSMDKLIDTLGFEIENPRLFDLLVSPENPKGTIEFLNLRPTDLEPKRNEVVLEIKSNVGRRYQVTQNLYAELMNKEGEIIRTRYFTLRTLSLDTKGTLKFPQAAEMKKGETLLFVSDEHGSADKFRVIYELAPSRDLKSGDYSTRITYTLSEI